MNEKERSERLKKLIDECNEASRELEKFYDAVRNDPEKYGMYADFIGKEIKNESRENQESV